MQTKLSMAMPEILSQEAFDVEIAAVSMLSSDDYEAFLGSNQLPEYALDRLKYTEAITTTPASCQIESYKAIRYWPRRRLRGK